MNDELVEKLALRLQAIGLVGLPRIVIEDLYGTADASKIRWESVHVTDQAKAQARECIRQMEWARQERTKEAKRMISQRRAPNTRWVSTEDELLGMDILDEPLTLAPDDWHPENLKKSGGGK